MNNSNNMIINEHLNLHKYQLKRYETSRDTLELLHAVRSKHLHSCHNIECVTVITAARNVLFQSSNQTASLSVFTILSRNVFSQ